MEKEERINLVVKLYKKMQFAKFQAETQDRSDKDNLFLQPKGYRINPKFLSKKQYFKIAQFYVFLKENPDLTDEQIKEVLNSNNKFSFLRKLDSLIPDFFEELKLHGPMTIAVDYASRKQTNKELTKRLP